MYFFDVLTRITGVFFLFYDLEDLVVVYGFYMCQYITFSYIWFYVKQAYEYYSN